jgi:hypothetical protein
MVEEFSCRQIISTLWQNNIQLVFVGKSVKKIIYLTIKIDFDVIELQTKQKLPENYIFNCSTCAFMIFHEGKLPLIAQL